jgi:hypothetical protein
VGEIPVNGGAAGQVRAIAVNDLRLLVRRGEDRDVVVEARLPRLLQAPVRGQQPLGDVVVRQGDRELGRVAVVSGAAVPATGWLAWYWNRALARADDH